MKKVLSAFGLLAIALVMFGAPAGAQTPGDITATITTAPSAPTAGTNVIVTAQFSIPANSTDPASVSVAASAGTPTFISATGGLSSCVTGSTSITCTWSTPLANDPQTLILSVPAGAGTMTFTALAGSVGGTLAAKATASVTVGQATTTTAAGTTTTAATTTVAPTTTAAPPTTAAPTTTVAPTTTAAALPATGSNSTAPVVFALVAIALGVLLVGSARLLKSRS